MAYFDKYGVEFSDDRKTLVKCIVFKGECIIPNSVTSIGSYAFEDCSGLTSVTIPNSVISIGENAFHRCSSLTSVTIPNSVTSIGDNAFRGCSSLTSVTIPNSVKSIGEGAFEDCSSLPIIDNICYADTYLVKVVNKKIPSYNIKEDTRFIGSSAFAGCSSLISIEIPNSVISIGEKAFWCCSRLSSVTIPASVKSIGNSAFSYCNCLNSIIVERENNKYDSRDNCNAIIEKDTNKLIISCKTTIIPNSVISIGDGVFSAQCHLTSIKIPNSVTHIGKYSLAGCSNLKSVTIPDSVTSIGDRAFENCNSLTSVTIPNSVTNIGSRAFIGCRSLTAVNIPNSVTDIGEYAFADCSSLKTIAIPASVKSIGQGGTFMGCSALESVQWNATNCSIVEIDDDEPGKYEPPFDNLGNIKSFTFGNNVKSIPKYLCGNLRGLTSLTFSDRITSIGEEAFCGCNNLTEIIVPNGQKARFAQMEGLKELSNLIVERDNEELTILTNLAKAYEKGIGVNMSISQAFLIHTQAAEKGSAESAYRLAEWYYEGKVIPCDLNKALAYFQQAAKTGYLDADNKVIEVQEYIVKEKQQKMSEFIADVNNKREKALIQHNRAKREKEAEDFECEHDLPSYSQYGGYNGYDDDTIDSAFEGDPEATWNVD